MSNLVIAILYVIWVIAVFAIARFKPSWRNSAGGWPACAVVAFVPVLVVLPLFVSKTPQTADSESLEEPTEPTPPPMLDLQIGDDPGVELDAKEEMIDEQADKDLDDLRRGDLDEQRVELGAKLKELYPDEYE